MLYRSSNPPKPLLFSRQRTTIGISFAATLLAYFVGITLGIAAAVAGKWTDAVLSRLVDAILAFPNIMLGLIIIAGLVFMAGLAPLITGSTGLEPELDRRLRQSYW